MLEQLEAVFDIFVKFCGDYEWIGSKTLVLLSPSFNEAMDGFSKDIGLEAATLKYVVMLLAAYPLAFIFSHIPDPTAKHAYSFLVGLWMMQNIFLSQWIHSLITSCVTYFLILMLPNKIMPRVVFAFLLFYICGSHIYRMYVDFMGWSLDFTGPQMLFTMKLSALAYNIYDGRMFDKLTKPTGNSKTDGQNALRAKFAIKEVPSLIAYLGFTYCFATVLAGPAFEYKEYIDSISGESYKSSPDANGTNKRKSVPPRFKPTFSRLFIGLVCLAVHQVGSIYYPIDIIVDHNTLAMSPIPRYIVCWLALLFCRLKYYFAWKVTNGAAVLCGFGYEGVNKDGKHMWNGIDTIDILGFETAENMTGNTRSWNKMAQNWLERYVYARTNNSLTATYFVSAFWHGFYPGYYLFFMSLPLAQQTLRVARKNISPHFYRSQRVKMAYHYFCIIINSVIVNYLVIPFQLLSWKRAVLAWGSYYYGIHIAIVIVYALAKYVIKPPKDTKALQNGNSKKDS